MDKLTIEGLDLLISEVEKDYLDLMKSVDAPKAKVVEAEGSGGEPEKAPAMKKEEKPAEEVKKDDMDAAPAEEMPPEEAAPEAPAPEQEMPAQDDNADLMDIYMQMDEEELEAHYAAIMAAAEQKFGAAQEAAPEAPAPEAPAEEAPAAPAEALEASEEEAKEDKKKDEEMEKMAQEIASLKKSLEEKAKESQELEGTVERLVKAASDRLPARKTITGDDVITKGDSLTKSEEVSPEALKEKALQLTRKPLQKSERDTLNKWFVTSQGAEAVVELTKTYKV